MSNLNVTGGSGNQLPPNMQNESRPVRMLGGLGAALLAIVGGLALIPGIPNWVPAAVGLAGLFLTTFVTKTTESKTVPLANTKAIYIDSTGETVAGPASVLKTGTVVEEPVAADPTPYGGTPR